MNSQTELYYQVKRGFLKAFVVIDFPSRFPFEKQMILLPGFSMDMFLEQQCQNKPYTSCFLLSLQEAEADLSYPGLEEFPLVHTHMEKGSRREPRLDHCSEPQEAQAAGSWYQPLLLSTL